MTINMNQFAPGRLQGELEDNQPFGGRVESALVSPDQATDLVPGMAVKLDTPSQPGMFRVLAAGQDDVAFGVIIYDPKKSSYGAGDIVQVARPGCVVVLTASGAITVGDAVEDTASSGVVSTKNSHTKRGEALDPATNGQTLRVLIRDY